MAKGLKTGGRKAGTPNRTSQELSDRIKAHGGKDPLTVMLELLQSNKPEFQLAAAKELLQYQFPKRKAVELSGSTATTVTFERLDGTAERYTIGPEGESDE